MLEATARATADLLYIPPNSVALFYHKIREAIDYYLTLQAQKMMVGEIDKQRSQGERRRGADDKVAFFWTLKSQGKVYTAIVNDIVD